MIERFPIKSPEEIALETKKELLLIFIFVGVFWAAVVVAVRWVLA